MSRPVKPNQGSSPASKNSVPHSSQSLPHTNQSAPPKGAHSMSHGEQPMPHSSQTLPRGPQSSVPRGPKSSGPREQQPMHEAYSMPYGGYGGYTMPHHGGYPMGYGGPPPMSQGGFSMNTEPQNRGMYTMYGSQTDNKNKMKTLSKSQRENLSRAGGKTGSSYQRAGGLPEMNRMTMDYEGRFIDSRGRVVDYSRNVRSPSEDPRYMFVGRDMEMPREDPVLCSDYGMPGYLYGNMLDNPDVMLNMEMQGRYPPYFGQYADDEYECDYNEEMMAKMMNMPQGYMDATGGYSADFQDMPFPDSRRMDSAGRYGDSFDR